MNEKQQKPVTLLTVTGLFAAIITLMTAYICHIPYGANGGYIHFGDALIYVAAVILPRPYAMAAAAIGGGLADLLTAPMWAPATIIIKMLITLPFTSKNGRMLNGRNIIAPFLAALISSPLLFPQPVIILPRESSLVPGYLSSFLLQEALYSPVEVL